MTSTYYNPEVNGSSQEGGWLPLPLSPTSQQYDLQCEVNTNTSLHFDARTAFSGSSGIKSSISGSSSSDGGSSGSRGSGSSGSTSVYADSLNMTGWALQMERKNKPGWVSLQPHSNSSASSLSFLLHSSGAPINTPSNANRPSVSMLIEYLRTYENAGAVDIFGCGVKLGSLDALWDDPATRISVSSTALVQFCNFRKLCSSNGYTGSYGNISRTIDIVHSYRNDRVRKGGNQKFKVLSVAICMESYCNGHALSGYLYIF